MRNIKRGKKDVHEDGAGRKRSERWMPRTKNGVNEKGAIKGEGEKVRFGCKMREESLVR